MSYAKAGTEWGLGVCSDYDPSDQRPYWNVATEKGIISVSKESVQEISEQEFLKLKPTWPKVDLTQPV